MKKITGVCYGRFDGEKVVHPKRGLSAGYVDILLRNGFKQIRDPGFSQGMGTAYFIKNWTGESDEHFMLCNLLLDEIRKYTPRVEYNLTVFPDMAFGLDDGRWVALEIEDKRKSLEELASKLTKASNYSDFFYLVTNWELLEHYREYAPTFTRRSVQDKIRSYFRGESQALNR